jgi:hypothetical protein
MVAMYDIYQQFRVYIITIEGMGMKTVYYLRPKSNFVSLTPGAIFDINASINVRFKNPLRIMIYDSWPCFVQFYSFHTLLIKK